MIGMLGSSWQYKKYTYTITEYEYFDVYRDFAEKYVTPFITDARNYLLIVNLYNNTSNTRAAIYHVEYIAAGKTLVEQGERVGGNFDGPYGANLYAGATLEIYISSDLPQITFGT